ncbi:hypothetical protein ABLO16_06590, partial [Mycobacterium tuberculosis]
CWLQVPIDLIVCLNQKESLMFHHLSVKRFRVFVRRFTIREGKQGCFRTYRRNAFAFSCAASTANVGGQDHDDGVRADLIRDCTAHPTVR